MGFLIYFILGIFLYIIFGQIKKRDYWRKKKISSDDGIPFFGSMLKVALFRKSEGELFNDLYKKFQGEKVVGIFHFNNRPALVIRDPAIIHKILVKDFHHFANNDFEMFDEKLDWFVLRNILFQRDETWKKNKALMASAFTASKVKLMYPQIVQVAQQFVEYLENHTEEIQVKEAMMLYTGEVTARVAFGIDGRSFKDPNPLMSQLGKMLFRTGFKIGMIYLMMLMTPWLRRLLNFRFVPDEACHTFQTLLYDVITHRKQNNDVFHDLIQFLLDAKEKENEKVEVDQKNSRVSDINIVSTCITFFLEGYETSSGVLSHIMYNLARNKEVQDKLRDEIEEAMSQGDGELSFETISDLPYLHCVLLESNRIFPVVFGLDKVCTEKYELDLDGKEPLIIEKGTPIHIPTYALHNDPLHWPDVAEFKPERFANRECVVAKSKGIFLPFGDGPRMCVGIRISMTLLKAAVAYIIQSFEVVPSPKTPMNVQLDPTYFLLSHKGGLYLKFVKRNR